MSKFEFIATGKVEHLPISDSLQDFQVIDVDPKYITEVSFNRHVQPIRTFGSVVEELYSGRTTLYIRLALPHHITTHWTTQHKFFLLEKKKYLILNMSSVMINVNTSAWNIECEGTFEGDLRNTFKRGRT